MKSRDQLLDNSEITTKHNILLQYGECDLDEYFIDNAQPILYHEIGSFWENLFDVAKAIERIHNLRTDSHGVQTNRSDSCDHHYVSAAGC